MKKYILIPAFLWLVSGFMASALAQTGEDTEKNIESQPVPTAVVTPPQVSVADDPYDIYEKQPWLASPFKQLKKLKTPEEKAKEDAEEDSGIPVPFLPEKTDVQLPPPAEQRYRAEQLREKVDILLREELLPDKYVRTSVDTQYLIQTDPITTSHKNTSRRSTLSFSAMALMACEKILRLLFTSS